ncbi:hypothetical protein SKAU_G00335900 [Synaphobranchus kaupii]|uniref:Uncharacterized protein n=1 Tax=Synaphobranchus kaupii TaxID=118154 RepID=A0A9Q1ELZ8_SYNKA|nr:hypothetical protein SKAU_G00335900 [Synaphobranchus kaupii]
MAPDASLARRRGTEGRCSSECGEDSDIPVSSFRTEAIPPKPSRLGAPDSIVALLFGTLLICDCEVTRQCYAWRRLRYRGEASSLAPGQRHAPVLQRGWTCAGTDKAKPRSDASRTRRWLIRTANSVTPEASAQALWGGRRDPQSPAVRPSRYLWNPCPASSLHSSSAGSDDKAKVIASSLVGGDGVGVGSERRSVC